MDAITKPQPVEKSSHLGFRVCSAEDTFDKIWPLRHQMGITRLGNITGLDKIGIPVYIATRPNSRMLSLSQGKGCRPIDAKVSALMESVESYHAEYITRPLKNSTYNDLAKNHPVADIGALPQYLEKPYEKNIETLWIEGFDILNKQPKWLPYESVHEDSTIPLPAGHGYFPTTSNGLASGNHPNEAIIHGFCETIERDSIRLWQLLPAEQQLATKIDLSTVNDRDCLELLENYKKNNILVGIWDMTSDTGIPCFLCRIISTEEPDKYTIRPASGMGCFPNKSIALRRALTEAAQSRLTFISGARDDIQKRHYKEFTDTDTYQLWHDVISAQPRGNGINYGNIFTHPHSSQEDLLGTLLNSIKKIGLSEVITVNLTKPHLNIPVFKTVVPGLEPPPVSPHVAAGKRARKIIENFAKELSS